MSHAYMRASTTVYSPIDKVLVALLLAKLEARAGSAIVYADVYDINNVASDSQHG